MSDTDGCACPTANATSISRCAPTRNRTIAGTLGFMAPEIIAIINARSAVDGTRTYSSSVDWWSLGVTVYKLLTNAKPYACMQVVSARPQFYYRLEKDVDYSDALFSESCHDFVSRLLAVDEQARLGWGENGLQDVLQHEYFAGIDWEELESKALNPPYIPSAVSISVVQRFLYFFIWHFQRNIVLFND